MHKPRCSTAAHGSGQQRSERHHETEAVGTRICTTEGKSSKREVSWESWDTSAWMEKCDTGLQARYRERCDLDEEFRAEEAALPSAGSFHLVIQQSGRHPELRDPTFKLSWVRDGSPQQQLNLLCCCGQCFSHSATLRLGLGRTPWKAWIDSAPAWCTPKVPLGNKVFLFQLQGSPSTKGVCAGERSWDHLL